MSLIRRFWRAPLLHFIAIGGLIYLASSVNRVVPPVVLEVDSEEIARLTTQWQRSTGRVPNQLELDRLIEQFIDDELLIEMARSLGWERNDPVIQRRLIQNLRFLDAAEGKSDAQLLRDAYALDMERSDIVVRRRLLERVRLLLAEGARSREPTDEQLKAYLDAHQSEFLRPGRIRLTQIYLSRDRRGATLHTDAVALVQSLERSEVNPDRDINAIVGRGDPFLLRASLPLWSLRRLSDRLGHAFAEAAAELPVGVWSGPIVSSYGEHAVWVHERRAEEIPALQEIRDSVAAELHRRWETEALHEVIARLRSQVEIRVAGRGHPDDTSGERRL